MPNKSQVKMIRKIISLLEDVESETRNLALDIEDDYYDTEHDDYFLATSLMMNMGFDMRLAMDDLLNGRRNVTKGLVKNITKTTSPYR